jgi:hypothetical protein
LEAEVLEDRSVPSTLSITDASAIEGDATIRPLGVFASTGLAGESRPHSMILGPDGNLYVSIHYVSSPNESGAVYRYDAVTGSPLPAPGKSGAEFVSPGSGGLTLARDMAFGPDGDLYALSEGTDSVLRFDPTTGAYKGVFVASGSGGLDAPRDFLFRDGYLYVASCGPLGGVGAGVDSVLRYDATTGAPAGLSGQPGDAVFIASGSGGLNNPSRMVFGPDGKVYVSSTAPSSESPTSNAVMRYDSATGAPAGVSGQPGDAFFVSQGSGGLDGPTALIFRPDGYLYVASWRNDSVFRYDSATGAFAGTVITAGSGGLDAPLDLLFEPDGNFLVTSWLTAQVLRYGAASQAPFAVSLSKPSAVLVTVSFATTDGTAIAGSDYTQTSGTLTFAPGQTTRTILVQTLDDTVAEGSETFTVILSNPVGATITDDQSVGTILDKTKFYVVNDAGNDRTYEYGATGLATENYSLGSGNTAPRGAASNIAGDKVWVVDGNRNVYVYNASGGLLGSWSAGSMNASAQVEGIATNGTDIWLADAKQDKVYRYTGAATRLTASQNAASSFNLNSANSNPKDLVTDGTSIWVVNDSSTDKVFKYNLSGTLIGSWTIDAANSSPTGLTINPASVSDIWIVDSGTKKVYQYANVAGKTSGSQNAAATFALAAGNTNPQGIADPPPPSALISQTPVVVSPSPEVGNFNYLAHRAIDNAVWGPITNWMTSHGLLDISVDRNLGLHHTGNGSSVTSLAKTQPDSQKPSSGGSNFVRSDSSDSSLLDQIFADLA